MKTKLSPLEELRADRLQLKEECSQHGLNIKDNLSFLKSNWGTLLFASALNSSKNAVTSLFADSDKSKGNSFFSKALTIAPIVWEIAQPVLLGMAAKKAKSFLFGRKRKKKNQFKVS